MNNNLETTTICVRKGINGFKYSVCQSNGEFLFNADSLKMISRYYKTDKKCGYIKIERQLDKFPN